MLQILYLIIFVVGFVCWWGTYLLITGEGEDWPIIAKILVPIVGFIFAALLITSGFHGGAEPHYGV